MPHCFGVKPKYDQVSMSRCVTLNELTTVKSPTYGRNSQISRTITTNGPSMIKISTSSMKQAESQSSPMSQSTPDHMQASTGCDTSGSDSKSPSMLQSLQTSRSFTTLKISRTPERPKEDSFFPIKQNYMKTSPAQCENVMVTRWMK